MIHLNFTLSTIEERNQYIKAQLKKYSNPTKKELELYADYILWGKNSQGKNANQTKELQLKSFWNNNKVESLDALMDNPLFNEAELLSTISIKKKKEIFSREKALSQAPPLLREDYKNLFHEIDTIDLLINYYDIIHGRRVKPPRDELLNRLSSQEKEDIYARAQNLSSMEYFYARKEIVEKRRLQYTWRDSYTTTIFRNTNHVVTPIISNPDIKIRIFPPENGLISQTTVYNNSMNEKQINSIIKEYWRNFEKDEILIDFRDPKIIRSIISNINEMSESIKKCLKFYISEAFLTPIQRDILDSRLNGETNRIIVKKIEKKYGKKYSINYISTIINKQIILTLAEAARFQEQVIQNLPYPENFLQCSSCGKYFLLDPYNFVRKTNSPLGFTRRCKRCDRIRREEKKGGLKNAKKKNKIL